MIGKIRKCDYTGDSELAQFDTEKQETVEVAQEALTKFLDGCVKQYGIKPPVWARRVGEREFNKFDVGNDSLLDRDELIVQFPMVGG